MYETPETIYLIPGEYEEGLVWCDDPAPDSCSDPDDAVKYVRADIHESALKRQGNAAKMGMDAAKKDASWREENARRLLAESNPAALESERAANAELTVENERLQARVAMLEDFVADAQVDALRALDPDYVPKEVESAMVSLLERCKTITREDDPDDIEPGAFILRRQAEAVVEVAKSMCAVPAETSMLVEDLHDLILQEVERLRDEAEKAGGTDNAG